LPNTFKDFEKYTDEIWKLTGNPSCYLEILDTDEIEKIVEQLTLFDLKTKIHMFKVYN